MSYHKGCCLVINNEVHPRVIQILLGHEIRETIKIYVQFSVKQRQRHYIEDTF
jgi:site-specific recombinase XerD